MANTYTVHIEEDPVTGDAILPFPPELIAEVGWVEGDELEWDMQPNNTVILRRSKIENGKNNS